MAAIRAQVRSDHRLPAALMLLFRRVAGRPLDGFDVPPRSLLRKTAEALAVSAARTERPSIQAARKLLDIPGWRTRRVGKCPRVWCGFERADHLDVVRLPGERQDIIAILGGEFGSN